MTVGVLALQGDFAEHRQTLSRHGLPSRLVRAAADLDGLSGLVLPGGESTTMLKLLCAEGLFEPLGKALRSGIPVLATCAGLILLAEEVRGPEQPSYGLLPLTVVRNGYGRQFHSGTFPLRGDVLPPGTTGTFIRAPRIVAVREGCDVLAFRDQDPVLVQKGPILGCCFHPELQPGHPVTALWIRSLRAPAPSGHRPAAALA
jgi:5'-phosphate synthase pdxT subunit